MPAPADPARSAPEPPLQAVLTAAIRADGPISVERFMTLALGHPEHGYYQTRVPFGRGGDFVTAPEVSQMFGELIGLCLAQAWQDLGRPQPVRLVELGPGSGQLMADILRVGRSVAGFVGSLDVHLVELSQQLRQAQRQRLAGQPACWHDRLDEVPPGPLLCVANEFLDALPIRQYLRTDQGWRERLVGLDSQGALAFVPSQEHPAELPPLPELPPGAIAELAPARAALVTALAARLEAAGGLVLLIDYGGRRPQPIGDTLQAVQGHRPVDPLAAPGAADLSSQVDFSALADAASAAGATVWGPVPQGTFLRALGIELRAMQLMRAATAEQQRELRAALFRLTDASAMGELFKVMVLTSDDAPVPPGFAAPNSDPAAP